MILYLPGTLAISVAPDLAGIPLPDWLAPAADMLAATGRYGKAGLMEAVRDLLEHGTAEGCPMIADDLKPLVEALLPADPRWERPVWDECVAGIREQPLN